MSTKAAKLKVSADEAFDFSADFSFTAEPELETSSEPQQLLVQLDGGSLLAFTKSTTDHTTLVNELTRLTPAMSIPQIPQGDISVAPTLLEIVQHVEGVVRAVWGAGCEFIEVERAPGLERIDLRLRIDEALRTAVGDAANHVAILFA